MIIALPALALVAKFPTPPLIFMQLNNAAHAPAFGALAVVWLYLLHRVSAQKRWQPYLAAFALAVASGGLVELAQLAIGRGAEYVDLMTDALGALAGLALVAARKSRKKWLLLAAGAAVVPVVWPIAEAALSYQSRDSAFPTLIGNDTRAERYFIEARDVDFMTAMLPAPWRRAHDSPSLKIRVSGSWHPGIAHREPPPDWRGYSRLLLDMTNPGQSPLMLTVRLHDRIRDESVTDRFSREFTIAATERRVMSFSLAEFASPFVGRNLDLSNIVDLMIVGDTDPDQVGREYYLTRLWLE